MRRRTFVFATLGTVAALVVGWGAMPPRQRLRGSNPLPVGANEIALNGWVKVAADGRITVAMPKAEMGQGVHTALAMLVAEELDCGWANVRVEQSPIDKIYGNVAGLAEGIPFHPRDEGMVARGTRWTMVKVMREMGLMMTGGSSSIRDLWQPLREAAAMTRASILHAAANAWQVPIGELSLAEGIISHASGKRASLGEIVTQLSAKLVPIEKYTLKPASQFKIIGQALRRTDALAKLSGTAVFGIDIAPPDMLYAAIRMSPQPGGSVKSFDDRAAKALPGVAQVIRVDPAHGGSGGVAVVADRYWRARKALDALTIEWDAGAMAGVSSVDIFSKLNAALTADSGYMFWEVGDTDAAMATAARTLEGEYQAPYLAHATLEPMNCTVEFKDGRATVWVGTQVPDFARAAVAKILGLDEKQVNVVVLYLGGGFGRRLEVDYIAQAAAIAKQLPGRAVQVLWSREDDMQHDFYRPACISRFKAGLDKQGNVVAWQNMSAGQAIVPVYMPRNAGMPGIGPDKTASEGAFDQAYAFLNAKISHLAVELPVPIGFWRAVGHSHQAFFKESFVDECAYAAQIDPFQFRAALLRDEPRQLAVLKLAAEKSGWADALPAAIDGATRARGIALHESFGAIVAQVVEASIGADGELRVHRVVCALDCGIAVNPNIIRQQMESAIVFGLTAALYGQIDIEDGRIKQSNFHDYQMLRLYQAPLIETYIVPSTEAPQGIGEPGLPPIAPALGNAIFALTGQRLRSLPLTLASLAQGRP